MVIPRAIFISIFIFYIFFFCVFTGREVVRSVVMENPTSFCFTSCLQYPIKHYPEDGVICRLPKLIFGKYQPMRYVRKKRSCSPAVYYSLSAMPRAKFGRCKIQSLYKLIKICLKRISARSYKNKNVKRTVR